MLTIFGSMFWAAVGIILFHLAVSYIAPTRFQRLGAMWDAVERAKDIAIALAIVFAIFYGIMAVAASISGQFTVEKAWDMFARIVSKPLVDLYNKVFPPHKPERRRGRIIARPMSQPNFFSNLPLDPLFLSGVAVLSAQALYYISLWFVRRRSGRWRALNTS
jgi:hypothetical protein